MVLEEGRPRPRQVSIDTPKERRRRALDTFYEDHHDALEAAFVDPLNFDADLSVL